LKSCTDDISVIRFSIPEILDANVCLVDTPGFDDTNRSDVDIFKKISDWLNDTYVLSTWFLSVLPHEILVTRKRFRWLVYFTSIA
jgi:predicted GTPase